MTKFDDLLASDVPPVSASRGPQHARKMTWSERIFGLAPDLNELERAVNDLAFQYTDAHNDRERVSKSIEETSSHGDELIARVKNLLEQLNETSEILAAQSLEYDHHTRLIKKIAKEFWRLNRLYERLSEKRARNSM